MACGLAALFGVDAGIGAGGVEEGDDGAAELGAELHAAQRLAIAFGLGHAEVAEELLFGIAALFLADDHDGLAFEGAEAADDGRVFAKGAVAVDFRESRASGAGCSRGYGTLRDGGRVGRAARRGSGLARRGGFESSLQLIEARAGAGARSSVVGRFPVPDRRCVGPGWDRTLATSYEANTSKDSGPQMRVDFGFELLIGADLVGGRGRRRSRGAFRVGGARRSRPACG